MDYGAWIRQFHSGDTSDFDAFYQATSRQVYFTALGILKDRAAAEDVMQDTYVSFLRTVDRVRPEQNIAAYLCVIARNRALNLLKRDKRTVYGEGALKVLSAEAAPDNDGTVEQILSLLDRADEREIVTYHVVLGYKFREIAGIMRIPLDTVLWRYNKAIKALRRKMEDSHEKE